MPGRTPRPPKYRHYKPKDLAVVRIDGKDHYLGRYNSPESWERYGRKIAEWRATGTAQGPSEAGSPSGAAGGGDGPTVAEVILAYWRHAERYYRDADGKAAPELEKIRLAARPLRQLYGSTPAATFGEEKLEAVRQCMIDSGLCRRTINQRVSRIVRIFRYGARKKLVTADRYVELKEVDGLKKGRRGVREGAKVRPVPEALVNAVALPFLSARRVE